MTFKNLAIFTALLTGALCATLLLFPGLIFWLFAIEGDKGAVFFGRRAAMLFAGLSMLCWISRESTEPALQRAVSLCFATAMAGLALLGLYELIRGAVGAGILLAVVVEFALALGFGRIIRGANPSTH